MLTRTVVWIAAQVEIFVDGQLVNFTQSGVKHAHVGPKVGLDLHRRLACNFRFPCLLSIHHLVSKIQMLVRTNFEPFELCRFGFSSDQSYLSSDNYRSSAENDRSSALSKTESSPHNVTWIKVEGVMSIGRVLFCIGILLFTVTARAQAPGAYLGDLSWPEAERRYSETPIVIIPFGAGAKEHGPHIPMNADRVVMDHLVNVAIESRDVIVAPPILHGWFPAFREFPGTEVADPKVFQDYVFLVGMSLAKQGAQRIVFLNTGIAKATGLPISIAAREIRVQTGVPTLVVSWDDLETEEIDALQEQQMGGHGGEIETSINLYLQPDLVNMQLAVEDYGDRSPQDYGGYKPGVLARDPNDPSYSESGIFGDATLATPEKGKAALDVLTREWLKALDGFARVPLRRE